MFLQDPSCTTIVDRNEGLATLAFVISISEKSNYLEIIVTIKNKLKNLKLDSQKS